MPTKVSVKMSAVATAPARVTAARVAIVMSAVLMSAVVSAQPPPPAPPKVPAPVPAQPRTSVVSAPPVEIAPPADDETLFAERDSNEDDWLSGKEVVGFEPFDADGDGEVSKKEFLEGRAAARRENPAEVKKSLELAFQALDKNEDGRLSGKEMTDFRQFDTDGDKRVTKEEFLVGMLAARRLAKPNSATTVDMSTLHEAIRTRKGDLILSRAAPSFRPLIDAPVLALVLTAIHELLGEIAPYDAQGTTTQRVTLEEGTRWDHTATLVFDKGEAQAVLQVIDNRVVGLSVKAKELDVLNKWMFDRIGTNEPTARAMAEFLKPQCARYVQLVLGGAHDEAFEMFHPLVRKQLDKDNVLPFFAGVQEENGEFKSLELESQRLEAGEQGEDATLAYDYVVRATKQDFMATVTFQFVGMKAGVVKFGVRELKEGEGAPAEPPAEPPVPAPGSGLGKESAGWTTQRLATDGLSVKTPVKLVRQDDKDGSVAYVARDNEGGFYFEVRVHTFATSLEGKGKEALDEIEASLPKNLKGELLDSDDAPLQKHPGRVFAVRLPNGKMYVNRAVLIGKRMYQLQVILSDKDQKQAKQIARLYIESLEMASDDDDAPSAPAPGPPAPPAPPAPALPAPPAPPRTR